MNAIPTRDDEMARLNRENAMLREENERLLLMFQVEELRCRRAETRLAQIRSVLGLPNNERANND